MGDNALAAVGSAAPLFNLLLVLFVGISAGVGIMVSQYFGAKDIQKLGKAGNGFSKIELNTDKDGTEYGSFYGDNSRGEAAFVLFNAANFQVPLKTGQYFVLKYRVPTTNADKRSIEVFSSTIDNAAKSGHNVWYGDLIRDDQWHVLVLDFAKLKPDGAL